MNEMGGFMISKVIYELTKFEIADIIRAQGGKMNISEIAKTVFSDLRHQELSLSENNEKQEIFNKAMIEQDNIASNGLYQDYDWSQYCNTKFVDVAGGIGGFLTLLMMRYPTMNGVLNELPKVIEMSEQSWSINHKQLLNRVQFVRDLKVMCLLNGKERTKSEMEKILDKSGWKFMKITSCRGGFSVIEAVPL
ncbi:hypothetical protein C2G38_2143539 [Gigaspora rosea]|uniref:O-methyltransferase C-terminal domain-containing protein n=1 Tax=Gigaspora rosea TaxID=44941 RepID=A0A397UZ38_9GLOM|nr:hypothetical protein C2G38_2143539 [Gigaspora rosea]